MSSRIYIPKASKNHSKFVHHLTQNGANMVQNQSLEGVWGAFGRLWGALGRPLGGPRRLRLAIGVGVPPATSAPPRPVQLPGIPFRGAARVLSRSTLHIGSPRARLGPVRDPLVVPSGPSRGPGGVSGPVWKPFWSSIGPPGALGNARSRAGPVALPL